MNVKQCSNLEHYTVLCTEVAFQHLVNIFGFQHLVDIFGEKICDKRTDEIIFKNTTGATCGTVTAYPSEFSGSTFNFLCSVCHLILFYPLASEVAKGYSNATVRPSVTSL